MQRKLLDILACPIDKHYPLQLMEFNTKEEVILDGVLLCSQCGRYYPIIDEIPVMLPDDLRTKASIQKELARVLPSMDPFWPRWVARTENLA